MIGFQDIIIKEKVNVYKFADKIGVQPNTIYKWFNTNKVPKKRLKLISEILQVDESILNKIVNDIRTYKPRGFNHFEIHEDITIIHIKRKDGIELEAVIDTQIYYEKLKDFKVSWYSVWDDDIQNYYVRCTLRDGVKSNGKTKYKMLYLHRYIMDAKDNEYVDHINHNSLDNTRNNLRITTDQENVVNRKGANKNNKSTGVRNVCFVQDENIYRVQIMKDGLRYRWEFSPDQFEEACKFAEEKRKELFGKFAGKS